ncbi:MAG: FtsX-like permease family protein [Bacteroidetes bacterium]|nr:FtsX-like permease family protein [Bacteroidota bacterium]MCL2302985.1 FtsX-like permease family protein [Lentimicrobiaceae bacterium]
MNILRLAWKNIWRNKVRSGVILSAIAIGLFAGTFLLSFMQGWILGTVNSDIKTQYSHVQIHNADFLANYDVNAFFMREDVENEIRRGVARNAPTAEIAFRLNLNGMLASPHNAIGVTAKGVFEDEEILVTDVWQQIPDTMGVFLNDDTRMAIVISSRVADRLRVRLRSRIVFTFQDVHGDMQSIAFRVGGIYRTTNAIFDEANVFVRYSDIFSYTGLPEGAVHEAAVLLPDIETSNIVAPQLREMFPDMSVQDWSQMNPALSMYFSYTKFMGVVILGIFLFALSFGIINTMLMAVLERTRELGMLGAIGMSKRQIFSMIMLETVFLTLLGGIVGIILGIAVVLPTMETGIDLSFFMEDQFEDFGFASVVYPILNIKMLAEIVVLVILAGILSALYPARKALQLKPLEAMRQ